MLNRNHVYSVIWNQSIFLSHIVSHNLFSSCLILYCFVLYCLVSFRLVSSTLELPCLDLPCLILSYILLYLLVLPCLALPCPALPCLALYCCDSVGSGVRYIQIAQGVMRFPRDEGIKPPHKQVQYPLRQEHEITIDRIYGVPSYKRPKRSLNMDCVTKYLWDYVSAPIDYAVMPYYLKTDVHGHN